jgi:hypothetical protein
MALHTDTYVVDGHMIWGATARIVSDLLERIGGMLHQEQTTDHIDSRLPAA